MATVKKTTVSKEEAQIAIERLAVGTVDVHIIGTSGIWLNRMSKKAREELLLPRRPLNKAARQSVLKHDPPAEYREAIYRCSDPNAPTYIHFPAGGLKKAMCSAALDLPGATKAQIGRLVKVLDETVYLYGRPYLHMEPVRMAGPSRTPDIRTRAMLKTWCCKFTVQYVKSLLREADVANLIDGAGIIVGIGDGRTEKGTYDRGGWEVVQPDDKRWHEIAKNGGRKIQEAAMAMPEAADEDTEDLLAYYEAEIVRREVDRKTTKAPLGAVLAAGTTAARRKPKASVKTVVAAKANGETRNRKARARA